MLTWRVVMAHIKRRISTCWLMMLKDCVQFNKPPLKIVQNKQAVMFTTGLHTAFSLSAEIRFKDANLRMRTSCLSNLSPFRPVKSSCLLLERCSALRRRRHVRHMLHMFLGLWPNVCFRNLDWNFVLAKKHSSSLLSLHRHLQCPLRGGTAGDTGFSAMAPPSQTNNV